MKRFSNDAVFKQFLEEKKVEILQRTSDGVQETQQFQLLLSRSLIYLGSSEFHD